MLTRYNPDTITLKTERNRITVGIKLCIEKNIAGTGVRLISLPVPVTRLCKTFQGTRGLQRRFADTGRRCLHSVDQFADIYILIRQHLITGDAGDGFVGRTGRGNQ